MDNVGWDCRNFFSGWLLKVGRAECLVGPRGQPMTTYQSMNPNISNAQITQTLKFWYAQYMCNHQNHIFWPLTHPNPNCTFCTNNEINTWPHLLSKCINHNIKGLRIACNNKVSHQIVQTLQSNKHPRFYTFTNACNKYSCPQNNTNHSGSYNAHAPLHHVHAQLIFA